MTSFGKKAEDVGEKVIEKGSDLAGKAKDMADKVGEKVSEKMGRYAGKVCRA